MSLESGSKFGYYASLINVILPIAAIVSAVAIIFSIIASAATGIAEGTAAPVFSVFGGFIIFIIAIVAVGIAGFIMFMYAMHSLSNYYNEPVIFKNVLYAFIISIASAAVIFALEFAAILSTFVGFSPTNTSAGATSTFTQFFLAYVV